LTSKGSPVASGATALADYLATLNEPESEADDHAGVSP
jgi:hypothetical protein